MKNLAVALIVSAQAFTAQATKLTNENQLELDTANQLALQQDDPLICEETYFYNGSTCQECRPLCKTCFDADTCDECIEHAYFDTDEGKCHCNRTLKHWAVTNKCYQPELCENEIVFVSAHHSSLQHDLVSGVELVVDPEFTITNSYCPIDCRLFIQEHDVVRYFDRTTGVLTLFTDDATLAATEFDYAIRCESVFSKSGVQISGLITCAGSGLNSENDATRHGDDSIFLVRHQSSDSCSDDGVSISEYDELLPKNQLEDLSFHLHGSISSMSVSCEQLECATAKVWDWHQCACVCPDVNICANDESRPDFNEETCECECIQKDTCCPPEAPEFSIRVCGCICPLEEAVDCAGTSFPTLNSNTCECVCELSAEICAVDDRDFASSTCTCEPKACPLDQDICASEFPETPIFNDEACSCECSRLEDADGNEGAASDVCLSENAAFPNFNSATCSCECTRLEDVDGDEGAASGVCLSENAAFPTFKSATCSCECLKSQTTCNATPATPTFVASSCDCQCLKSQTTCNATPATPTFVASSCDCQCLKSQTTCNATPATPTFVQSSCSCQCLKSQTTCNATPATPTFVQSSCSCQCSHWVNSGENQTAADVQCVSLNGPGYRFDVSACLCYYTAPIQARIFFEGCGQYLLLGTDTNLPSFDVDPVTFVSFPKNSSAGDGDLCHTANNVDYELRRSSSVGNTFNIYPSPGDPVDVIFIEGADRRVACPDRAFLQWTEENCAKSVNDIDASISSSLLYQTVEPTMAKINLVDALQASKFQLVYGDFCDPLFPERYMRIAPYQPSERCTGKFLSAGSQVSLTSNPNVFNVGISGKTGSITRNTSIIFRSLSGTAAIIFHPSLPGNC